jgi:hypothetical protein
MSLRSDIMSRFTSQGSSEPIFVPDLSQWHRRNIRAGILPERYTDWTLAEIYRDLELPIWQVVRPWRVQVMGLDSEEHETETGRVRTVETIAGVLTWRWERAPDGGWRQVEYPIKNAADLPAAVEWARALGCSLDTEGLTELEMSIGDDGILAIEIPPRPLMNVVSRMLGWEGRLDLLEEPAIKHITEHLEQRIQPLITSLAQISVSVHYAWDQLDGAVIPDTLFRQYLLPSYQSTMEELRDYHKRLVVQARGPIQTLLQGLADAGVDAVAGFSCPSEGEGSLADLHELADGRITLWGGIPGEMLLPETDRETFEECVREITRVAQGRERLLLGVSGGVPVQAELARLQAVPYLMQEAVA